MGCADSHDRVELSESKPLKRTIEKVCREGEERKTIVKRRDCGE